MLRNAQQSLHQTRDKAVHFCYDFSALVSLAVMLLPYQTWV